MMTLDFNNAVRWNSLILAVRPDNASALCADWHIAEPSCHINIDILDRKLHNVQRFPQTTAMQVPGTSFAFPPKN
jgi:hypothetical protein